MTSQADSARHVVSMGQLFSRLRKPTGGLLLQLAMHGFVFVVFCFTLIYYIICVGDVITSPGCSDLLTKMKSWSKRTNWSRNLHRLIFRFNMTLPVDMVSLDLPVRWRNQHVMMPWPVLPLSSWVKMIFKKTEGQPMLAGYRLAEETKWQDMFRDFWNKFRSARNGKHQVYEDHSHRLQYCIPMFLHGDEGRGKLRRAVMATSLQPVLLAGGHVGHSFNSRFLHSIMPGELYEGDMTLDILQDALVEDLQNLYKNGCEVLWLDQGSVLLTCMQFVLVLTWNMLITYYVQSIMFLRVY